MEVKESSLVVCGLPGSGKTTYLAALWHLVQSQEIETALSLDSLAFGEYGYLNGIRSLWQRGKKQARTVGSSRRIGIDLKSQSGEKARLLFLDHSGEIFDRLWEGRSCSKDVASELQSRAGVILFLRSEGIKVPVPLAEMLSLESDLIHAIPDGADQGDVEPVKERKWVADESPDQVKVVDLLQCLSGERSSMGGERLAVVVSAWDRVSEHDSADSFIMARMPLLWQYLHSAPHHFEWRSFGVSAQGGEYVDGTVQADAPEQLIKLLRLEMASSRICLLDGSEIHNDLTIPLEWVMQPTSAA